MILEHLWSYKDVPSEEAVRTHIKGLRMKLKAAGAPGNLIETVYGIGYRLKPQEQRATSRQVKLLLHQGSGSTRKWRNHFTCKGAETRGDANNHELVTNAQTKYDIAGVWEKYKGRVSEQVNVLLEAALTLENSDESLTE